MTRNEFEYQFARLNACDITDGYILFRKPLEIFDSNTNTSVKFQTISEALAHKIGDKTVEEILLARDVLFTMKLTGGRGASSGEGETFEFNHARSGPGSGLRSILLPAQANVRIKNKTLEGAMREFQETHANSDHEWAYEVDSNGYVHQYVEGDKTSVDISSRAKVGRGEQTMILHNHPSGGAFSDSDLLATSYDRNSKGIVASGRNYDYVFTKGTHFKANDFVKAVKTAEMKGKDYDDAVNKWLTRNQKKYGYKYYRKKN